MQHIIPLEKLGPSGQTMAKAVEKCVHCGFCLPTCPTYTVLGEEMDSPRGRIVLMKSVLEEDIDLNEALPYIDKCLGCLACMTACPSGVAYHELLIPFRSYAEKKRDRSLVDRVVKGLALETLPYPGRFRVVTFAGQATKPINGLLPTKFQAMLSLLPDYLPKSEPLPTFYPAQGKRRARVGLLVGCVQQVLTPEINRSTLRVLARNGVEVVIPKGQGCCGALSIHVGDEDGARELAIRNLKSFPVDVDAIITNTAGCGSGMHEYLLLFEGHPSEEQAIDFSNKVKDISEFLDELGIESPPPFPKPMKLAYHDACHLTHAQGITVEPRRLLQQIPNLHLVSLPESEICCGSAGTYNIQQPQTAQTLGLRKAKNIIGSGAEGVVMGNVGCMVQIQSSLTKLGKEMPIWHTMEVLDRAYQNGR